MTDYELRGKCREMSEEAVRKDPTLTLVRGHYWCPFWGKQPHWWTVKPNGDIFDPTANQFPSRGEGEYIPFSGEVECAQCGKQMDEDDALYESNYAFCGGDCLCRFVGL